MGLTGGTYSHDAATSVSLNALRGQTLQRLAGVEQRLESKGVGAAFMKAARDPIGDMGFLSSLIAHVILFAPMGEMLALHALEGFNHAAEAASDAEILRDDEASRKRSRWSSDYPEGRRRCAMAEGKKHRKFNLVSANQNNRLSYDAQAELACMYEILDLLDALEKKGARMIRLNKDQPAHESLQKLKNSMCGRDILKSYSVPVRKTV